MDIVPCPVSHQPDHSLMPLVLLGKPASAVLMKICAYWHTIYQKKYHQPIRLGVVQIGDHPPSNFYIQAKKKAAEALGIIFDHKHFASSIAPTEVMALIHQWNQTQSGIIMQLPVPASHERDMYLSAIHPNLDVDGLIPSHIGLMYPCTPLGCLFLLAYYGISVGGKYCVVVGRSALVGKPLARMLIDRDATVTLTHSKTTDLQRFTKKADILFVAAGKKHLIRPEHVNPESFVIDVGIHRTADGIIGDVHPDVKNCVKAYSPVPGGVGLMTVAALMWNTIYAAFVQQGENLNLDTCFSALRNKNFDDMLMR